MVTTATKPTSLEQFVHITAPPLPYMITAGRSVYRAGDGHELRVLHDTFDLIVMYSGLLHMRVGTETIDVGPQQILLLTPGVRHGSIRPCERTTVFGWIHFHCDGEVTYSDRRVIQRAAKPNKNKYYRKDAFPIVLPLRGTLEPAAHELLQADMRELEQVVVDRFQHAKRFRRLPMSEVTYQSLFLRILGRVGEVGTEPERQDDLAALAHRYLTDHFAMPLTVPQIAHVFSCDPAHLSRVLRERYGMSTLKLLTAIRVDAAKRLLVASDAPVGEIGRDVGFDTPSYFTKRFREATGMSPSEWREIGGPHGPKQGS